MSLIVIADEDMNVRMHSGDLIQGVSIGEDGNRIHSMDGEVVGYTTADGRVKDREGNHIGYLEK